MKNTLSSFALAAVSVFVALPAAAQSVDDLLKKHACLSCHLLDKKVVGPSYQEVAAKYRGQKDADKMLADKVKKGGVGVWGQIPMPPNPGVSDKDAQALVKWVLEQK